MIAPNPKNRMSNAITFLNGARTSADHTEGVVGLFVILLVNLTR